MCEGRRFPYKIDNFRRFPKSFQRFEQFHQKLVAIWSTSEKFAKLSYIIGYLDCFWANYARHGACTSTSNTRRYAGVPPSQALLILHVSAERAYWWFRPGLWFRNWFMISPWFMIKWAPVIMTTGLWFRPQVSTSWEGNTSHCSLLSTSWERNTLNCSFMCTSWEGNTPHCSLLSTSWEGNTPHSSLMSTSWEGNTPHCHEEAPCEMGVPLLRSWSATIDSHHGHFVRAQLHVV